MNTRQSDRIAARIKADFFERCHAGLLETPYPGYPERYHSSDESGEIPDGPWYHQPQPISGGEAAQHPWLIDMITDPQIGINTGTGKFWRRGPNFTVDPVVISRLGRKVLLIRRGDTGAWALPGGFIDGDEAPAIAAQRELAEETKLGRRLRLLSKPVLFYAGIVADKRMTAEAWAETSAYLFRPLIPWPHVHGEDDAQQARWFSLNALPEDFFGSHRILVDEAARLMTKESNETPALPIAA